METKDSILLAYTAIINDDWRKLTIKRKLIESLDEANKKDTRRIRSALSRIVKGTDWTIEQCKYWTMIDHSTRPVTSSIQGKIELYHFSIAAAEIRIPSPRAGAYFSRWCSIH